MYSVAMSVSNVFMVGIKGSGMTPLAELLTLQGYSVTGSDVPQTFFTDALLQRAGINYYTEFNSKHIDNSIDMVIHSAAYDPNENPELLKAKELNIPIYKYTDFLGYLSTQSISVGISGIHGKTTTTALTGTILKAVDLPVSTLVGSGVPSFNGSAIHVKGKKYFIAETCEYQRHFLAFKPTVIVITSLEMDHPDYFKDYEDIVDAFISYINNVKEGGTVILCIDDTGVLDLYNRVKRVRTDLTFICYGETGHEDYLLTSMECHKGLTTFSLSGFETEFKLRVPGHHTVLDAVAGIAVTDVLLKNEGLNIKDHLEDIKTGLWNFRGTKRRSEIIGEVDDILFMDDYAHHPTAIDTTLRGLRKYYPDRRIIVDFMSHTYTRTAKLLKEFASSFSAADMVVLNKIYSSARENFSGSITGEDLYNETKKHHNSVKYCPEYDDAVDFLKDILEPGDLFITMGAGNNWQIVDRLFKIHS